MDLSFLLFASETIGTNELAIWLAGISLVTNALQMIMSYFKDSKRSVHDKELAKLNNDRDVQLAKIKADTRGLKEDLQKAHEEHEELTAENEQLRSRILGLENSMKKMISEIKEKDKIIKDFKDK